MTGRDWREPLPTRPCQSCGASDHGCEAAALFGPRGRCCKSCDHDEEIKEDS